MILLEIITHFNSVWENVFFYLFILSIAIFAFNTIMMMRALKLKSGHMKLLQQQHVARVDVIRKENSDKLENLRIEMLRREEERTRQWKESEKETLHVLNGVSNLLELSDTVDKAELKKINKLLTSIDITIGDLNKNIGDGKN